MRKTMVFTLFAALILLAIPFAGAAQGATTVTLEDLTNDGSAYLGQTVTLEGFVDDFISAKSFLLGEAAALDNDQVLVIDTSGQSLPANLFQGDGVRVTGVVHASLQTRAEAGEITVPEDRAAFRRDWISMNIDMSMDGATTDTTTDSTGGTTDAVATTDPMVTPDAAATTDPMMTPDAAATTDPMATPDAAATTDPMAATPADSTGTGTGTDMGTDMQGTMSREAFDFYFGGGYPDAYDIYIVIEVTSVQDVTRTDAAAQ